VVGSTLQRVGRGPVSPASASAGVAHASAKRALAKGHTVGIYPEGTLTKDPQRWPQHAKPGTARLALETGAPIIPTAHWGLNTIFPRGSKRLRFRPFSHNSTVVFGPPLDYSDLWGRRDDKSTMGQLSKRLKKTIARMVSE